MTAGERALELTRLAAAAADDKQATEIVAFDVSEQLFLTDVFLLCTVANTPQMRAVQDAVEEALLAVGAKPVRREGQSEARWMLLDFSDVVVHVQHHEERAYYALERLWSDCPTVPTGLSARRDA